MVRRFGPPEEFDGYKVSGHYTFNDDAGNAYTVYDYKSTSLYNDDELCGNEVPLPTPKKFWTSEQLAHFSIGGHDACDVEAFSNWLAVKVLG